MSSTYSGIRCLNVYVYQMQRYGFWYPSRIYLIFFQTLQQPWGKMGPIPTFFTKQARNPHMRWVHTGATNASLATSSSITQTEPAAHRVGIACRGQTNVPCQRWVQSWPEKATVYSDNEVCGGREDLYRLCSSSRCAPGHCYNPTSGLAAALTRVEDSIPSVHWKADV